MPSYDVLMFGWEFPPHNSGGLGVACRGLAKALSRQGHEVTFVLPEEIPVSDPDISFVFAETNLSRSRLRGESDFMQTGAYAHGHQVDVNTTNKEGGNQSCSKARNADDLSLIETVRLYGQQAKQIARQHDFDVIHAHDWLTYLAGIAAREVSGKPLVSHIHATEHDRTAGQGVNSEVYNIEQQGFTESDHVLSVSKYTKGILVDSYGVPADKITPAHNGITQTPPDDMPEVLSRWKERGNKIILFLGRQTIQKGPDYFLQAAQKLMEIREDVCFVMAGSGDMQEELIEQAAALGIGDRVLFPGFVRGDKTDRLYQSADLYVLSSVSEPFGITPLEALLNRTPVLISKQSGVSEVINHALKIDFWDTDRMASRMDAVLRYPSLADELRKNGFQEAGGLSWDRTAKVCQDCYNSLVNN